MTGKLRRLVLGASAVSLLASTSAGFAQTGRTWVDPPSETELQIPRQAPEDEPAAPAPRAQPRPATSNASPKAELRDAEQESARVEPEPETKPATAKQEKQKAETKRETSVKSRQASKKAKPPKQKKAVARRKDSDRFKKRDVDERRTRTTRHETVQEGIEAGLEVMRLRTIQLPDGRRIVIMTKPDARVDPRLLAHPY